ncbi:MAG: hypothetical protein IV092_22910 [Burkholderiaceae bacterium]|nr:hypothetical protein [Burkholderiaceae bacterium]
MNATPTPAQQTALSILQHLQTVDQERQRRLGDPQLSDTVAAVKAYQRQRFADTYADLLASARYQSAARFFLDELYGPQDFSERDAQFTRVVPALARIFPKDVLHTVQTLAELHALSEQLDTQMAGHLTPLTAGDRLSAEHYAKAWCATGQPSARERQIALTTALGKALDEYTAKPLLRHALRMMRGPAKAAGLSSLQHFLETGFDTFKAMRGSQEFMRIVGERERSLANTLFSDCP